MNSIRGLKSKLENREDAFRRVGCDRWQKDGADPVIRIPVMGKFNVFGFVLRMARSGMNRCTASIKHLLLYSFSDQAYRHSLRSIFDLNKRYSNEFRQVSAVQRALRGPDNSYRAGAVDSLMRSE